MIGCSTQANMPQFKMIQYYGIYARRHPQDKKLYRAVSQEKHKPVSLQELYKKAMRNYKCWPPTKQNPPEGMTSAEIARMTDDDLLDMDDFLHEDVFGIDDENSGFFI